MKNNNMNYLLFWEKLMCAYRDVPSSSFHALKYGPRNHFSRSLGVTGTALTFNIDKGAGIVQLDIKYKASNAKSDKLMSLALALLENKDYIEEQLGTDVRWNDLPHAFSIQKYIVAPGFFKDETTWDYVQAEMVRWMKVFESVFCKIVTTFKHSPSTAIPKKVNPQPEISPESPDEVEVIKEVTEPSLEQVVDVKESSDSQWIEEIFSLGEERRQELDNNFNQAILDSEYTPTGANIEYQE